MAPDFDSVVEADDEVVELRRFCPMGTPARIKENGGFYVVVFWHRACTLAFDSS